jgi:pimeloyl-ACP methyl ester carboxylesterase
MPYATINDHQINYFDSSVLHQAQNEQFPILMIHGLGSSQNYWMPVISQISPTFRCIALDSYGAGRSKSKGEKLTLDGLAEDAVGLMDSLGFQKLVVAGHSMGGTMACIIASKHPDRVLGFVPVGPVNPSSVKPEMFSSRIETVLKGWSDVEFQFRKRY